MPFLLAEKCEIITTFSSCVLSIDTAKGDLPVSTAVLATHKNLEDQLQCKVADAVARPELRTARGDLEISVGQPTILLGPKHSPVRTFTVPAATACA